MVPWSIRVPEMRKLNVVTLSSTIQLDEKITEIFFWSNMDSTNISQLKKTVFLIIIILLLLCKTKKYLVNCLLENNSLLVFFSLASGFRSKA